MERTAYSLALLVTFCGCTDAMEPDAPSDTGPDAGFIVEEPTPPVPYLCADGREMTLSAFLGGVLVTLDGVTYEMAQVFYDGVQGHLHEGEGYGWISNMDMRTGTLAELGPGQTIAGVTGVTCTKVSQ